MLTYIMLTYSFKIMLLMPLEYTLTLPPPHSYSMLTFAHVHFSPPQAVCFEDPESPGEQGDMPFMVVETRNSRAGPRLRVTEREALDILAGVRGELEVGAAVAQFCLAMW